jgi:hypothetical protein
MWLSLYEQKTLRSCLKQLLRLYLLLHLQVLLLRLSLPCPTVFALPCCRLRYLTLSKPGQAHHKKIKNKTPTIKNPTSALCSSILISLWWTWRESNPRPTCLRFEGITTILYKPDPPPHLTNVETILIIPFYNIVVNLGITFCNNLFFLFGS